MKAKPVRTAMFNGTKYRIDIDPVGVDGIIDTYTVEEYWLRVFVEPNTKDGLIAILHEALHAENWTASEEVVDRVSTEIGRFLWRLGYRVEDCQGIREEARK